MLFLSIHIRRGCCWPSLQLPSEAAHLSLLSPARQKLLYTTLGLDRFLYFIGRPAREKVFFFFSFFFLRNDDGAGASILVISKEREKKKGS